MKPMLFNTARVRALLDGRKIRTMRVIKPQPPSKAHVAKTRYSWSWLWWEDSDSHEIKMPCHPGDILYVREAWTAWSRTMGTPPALYYKADGDAPDGIKWRPSIHMPREAARIFLRVTGVRVEHIQSMTMRDIQAEGVVPYDVKGGTWQQWQKDYMEPVWDSTIKSADRALYSWAANPWVWVIEFERISKREAEKGDGDAEL